MLITSISMMFLTLGMCKVMTIDVEAKAKELVVLRLLDELSA